MQNIKPKFFKTWYLAKLQQSDFLTVLPSLSYNFFSTFLILHFLTSRTKSALFFSDSFVWNIVAKKLVWDLRKEYTTASKIQMKLTTVSYHEVRIPKNKVLKIAAYMKICADRRRTWSHSGEGVKECSERRNVLRSKIK